METINLKNDVLKLKELITEQDLDFINNVIDSGKRNRRKDTKY
jgi:hypothetical protein